MAVQPIGGKYPGYQARVGTSTQFFGIARYGEAEAERKARAAERRMLRQQPPAQPRQAQVNNRSGLIGIRPTHSPSLRVLLIQASWSRGGKAGSTSYSTAEHGVLGAVALAIQARERGARQPVGLTPRQAWAVLRRSLES